MTAYSSHIVVHSRMLHNYVNDIKNSSQIYFHNAKMSSASGGRSPPLPLTKGFAPGPHLGQRPQTPINARATALAMKPQKSFPPQLHPTNRALPIKGVTFGPSRPTHGCECSSKISNYIQLICKQTTYSCCITIRTIDI